jgi:hypothetical protein
MRKWLWTVILFPLVLAGCASNHTYKVIPQGPPHQPNVAPASTGTPKNVVGMIEDVGIGNHNRIYLIMSNQKVSKVGVKYGVISKKTPLSQGFFSDTLSPGSFVYEIPGVNPVKALAVEVRGQYVKAINSNQQ